MTPCLALRRYLAALLICLALPLAGCAGRSPATAYYVLNSGVTTPSVEKAQGPRIQLRRVDIPAYLDRTAIVTREPNGVRLQLAEFHAWAEPLASGMQRVLSEAMTPLLLERGVLLQALEDDRRGPLQLFVQVQRFDGSLGGEAVLDARWSLRTSDDETVARGAFLDREPDIHDYDDLVKAESTLLRRLAAAMAVPVAAAAR